MADDPFSDITAPDEGKSGGDPFGDITAPEPEQRGIVARTTEGFRGAYSPMLEGAADKLVDKEKHPHIHKATQAAIDANPISWADKALAGVMGATGAAAGAGAGVAEKTGMVNKAEADRLQRDLTIIGQGAMIEPGMGLAAAKVPHAAERVAPTGGEAALHDIITGKPTPAPEPAPAPAARALVYDAITGERVEHLPEAAPEETSHPAVKEPNEPSLRAESEVQAENAARTAPERDPFADIQEEPPAHVTERIPDEAQPAGPPLEADQRRPLPDLPPPRPGTTRFYHGGRDPASGGGRWVTPDYKYARDYREGEPVSYVDVPNDHPLLKKSYDDTGTDQVAPYVSFEAPPEIAAKLKPVEPPPEPAGAPVDSRPIYRGHGRSDRTTAYNQGSGSAQTPIFGEGRYFSFDKAHAREFGPRMEEGNLGDVVKNPLIIRDGKQWRELTKEAGWSVPNPFGTAPKELAAQIKRLREIVEKRGHDGVVIEWNDSLKTDIGPNGENIKLLRNVFDKPQVVSFAKEAAAKVKAEKPPETLSQYIARNGGLELTPEARDMGLHKRFIPGAGNVARKNGKSLDGFWRERLMEAGYLDKDPDGYMSRDIRGELYDKLGGAEPAYSRFDRAPEPKMRGRDREIETHARSIMDAFEKEGLPKSELDTKVLYDAADRLYRGEAKDPFEAYDRTVMEAERNAQRGGMRGGREEVHPPGSERTGPGAEKAVPVDRPLQSGLGPVERVSEAPVSAKAVGRRQAMSRVTEPGPDGKPQLVLPGAERVTAAEIAKRKVAERQAQEKMRAKVPQKAADEGLFGDEIKQMELSWLTPEKKPDQALIQRQETVRGPRSGRPLKTRRIPIGTEQAILEKGYEKATGPKGEPQETSRQPMAPINPAPGTPQFNKRQQQARAGFASRVAESYKKTLQPELFGPNALRAEPVLGKRASTIAQSNDKLFYEGTKRYIKWNKISEEDQLKFMGQLERGQPVDPQFRGIAQVYRKILNEAYNMEKEWGSKANYVADYFPHLWDRPNEVSAFMQNRIQSLGDTWFQKSRTFDLIEDGLQAGYTLKSTNPEALMRMRLMASADMQATMEALHTFKQMKLAQKAAGNLPLERQGWRKINAPDREQWLIAPEIQPIWDNAVKAKGLWAKEGIGGDAFRAWMQFKSVWIPIKLAASAFHPLHVAGINLASAWARAADQMVSGVLGRGGVRTPHLIGAVNSFVDGLNPFRQSEGVMARKQWLLGENARSPEGKTAVRLMNEGGFTPMTSEQLRINAGEKLSDAYRAMNPFKMGIQSTRLLIQKAQSGIFEHWIPHLKAANYLKDAAALLERSPHLMNDPINRGIALRAIAKSIDNRFGEMFYSSLFWNRTFKDASIGSFLSLGWNLGFLREFGGAAMESVTRPMSLIKKPSEARQVARDATNKIKFAGLYFGLSAFIAAMIGKQFSGEDPKDLTDLTFPRNGLTNPDGSPGRFTTMFYNREIPMLMKHIQEHGGGVEGTAKGVMAMIWNKMLLQPLIELAQNRNYYGNEIRDEMAPAFEQAMQVAQHLVGTQMKPMSVTGAARADQTAGVEPKWYPQTSQGAMAYLGFGPAPAYAERTAAQNYLTHLYTNFVTPSKRPYEDEADTQDRMTARNKVLQAKQKGDPDEIEMATDVAKEAGLSKKYIDELGVVAGDQRMFRRLSTEQPKLAVKFLNTLSEAEREHYWKYASTKTRAQWNAEHGRSVVERADGGTVEDDGDVNDMNSPAFKKAVTSALASSPDAIAKRQEFYPNVKINSQAWDEHVKAMPESLNIEDRRPGYKGGLHQAVRRHYGYKQGGLA